jgi:protoheme IX farnesyltransferase
LRNHLSDWLTLTKINISLPVTLSAFTGFVLYAGRIDIIALYCCIGVLLLSSASSIINHLQEQHRDALMPRTRQRPVPAGRVSKETATVVVVLLSVIAGHFLYKTGWVPAFLGFFNMLWYNLVYTNLKKVTPFAVIPGSIVGAIPPIIGWTAAGGGMNDGIILMVAFFFFVGQVPHFWLLIMRYGKDYEMAGFPSLSVLFSARQIANLTLVWIAATAMSASMLILFGIISSLWLSAILALMVILLLISFRRWLSSQYTPQPKPAFIRINLFYLGVMALLIFEGLMVG